MFLKNTFDFHELLRQFKEFTLINSLFRLLFELDYLVILLLVSFFKLSNGFLCSLLLIGNFLLEIFTSSLLLFEPIFRFLEFVVYLEQEDDKFLRIRMSSQFYLHQFLL